MKQKLVEIAKILWAIPNSSEATVISIINPIQTEEEASRVLKYLQENKEQLKIGYLIKHKMEIIKQK